MRRSARRRKFASSEPQFITRAAWATNRVVAPFRREVARGAGHRRPRVRYIPEHERDANQEEEHNQRTDEPPEGGTARARCEDAVGRVFGMGFAVHRTSSTQHCRRGANLTRWAAFGAA